MMGDDRYILALTYTFRDKMSEYWINTQTLKVSHPLLEYLSGSYNSVGMIETEVQVHISDEFVVDACTLRHIFKYTGHNMPSLIFAKLQSHYPDLDILPIIQHLENILGITFLDMMEGHRDHQWNFTNKGKNTLAVRVPIPEIHIAKHILEAINRRYLGDVTWTNSSCIKWLHNYLVLYEYDYEQIYDLVLPRIRLANITPPQDGVSEATLGANKFIEWAHIPPRIHQTIKSANFI